jgi:shikimate dehydrogenase
VSDFITLANLQNWPTHQHHFTPPARLAVIGDPIAHSRSPQMHNPALKASGVDAQYIRVQVPAGQVKQAFTAFRAADFLGVNITIPHKFEALDAVDHLDPLAKQLGAVNTLAIRDGQFFGYNTDGPGFIRSVREAFQADLRDLRILILGAGGGAGRAVAVQCAMEGCWRLVLANRTAEKALQLARELRTLQPQPHPVKDISSIPWDDKHLHAELDNIDLIVNATSLGMKPGDAPVVPSGSLLPHHLVFDMVYRATGGPTPLIAAAHQAGAKTTDGLSLLLHQGAISFEHWFQTPAPLEAMRQGLLQAAQP